MDGPDSEADADGQLSLSPRSLGIGRLFERTSDAVVVSNLDGVIVLWNPAAERLFGWSAQDALGRRVDIIVPGHLRERHEAGMRRFRETGHGAFVDAGVALELPAITRDGQEVTVELGLSHFDHEGERYVLALIRDVTERARLRRDVEEEREALRAANESLEAFAYVVSHDLKEPVRGVAAYLDALREDLADSPHAPLVERAIDANLRMDRLLRGLLEWSRAAATPVEPRAVDVREALRDASCAAYYEHLIEERDGRLEVDPDVPRVLATVPLLCQALGNLITNAIRHNPGPRPRVRVRGRRTAEARVELLVEDDGPGYPQAVMDRAHHLRNRPSTVRGGFGLAITRRAIERLGGDLELQNPPEGGGRAILRLPAAP